MAVLGCREQTSDKRRDTRTSPVGNGSRKHLAYCVSQSENEEEVGYLAQIMSRTWQHLQNLDIASTQIEAGVQQPEWTKIYSFANDDIEIAVSYPLSTALIVSVMGRCRCPGEEDSQLAIQLEPTRPASASLLSCAGKL